MYIPITNDPMSALTYLFLALAILALWIHRLGPIWFFLAGISSLLGLVAGRVFWIGLVAEGVFCSACFAFFRLKLDRKIKTALGVLLGLFSLALGMHQVPGFKNCLILSQMSLSPDSVPIQFYLNLDKPLIGLFLIGWGYPTVRGRAEWRSILKTVSPLILGISLILLGLSSVLGSINLDLKWFNFSWLWLASNLLFTCVAEEAFFRGFLQKHLVLYFSHRKHGPKLAWIVVSVLFGAIHAPAGMAFVFLATLAGLAYGYAYLKTNRLEASILTHFAVNSIHFLAFTYPILRIET
jgi:membrane protease YdiL (CAAX protease family)